MSLDVKISNSIQTHNLLKTLELILDEKEPEKYSQFNKSWFFKKTGLAKDCISYTQCCIQSHRFKAAAKILEIMCQERSSIDHLLFKASMLVLENVHNDSSGEQILQFVRYLRRLKHVNKLEVTLEYVLYALRNDVPDAKNAFQDLMLVKNKNRLRKNKTIDSLLKGYSGMFDYIEWCKSTTDESQATYGQNAAEKSIYAFRECLVTPGRYDVFILKLAEMLEFYGRLDELETDLINYVELNPEHINAYMYLCNFLKQYHPESKKIIKYLKVLVRLSPSDPSVLLLIEKWDDDDTKMNKMLKLLFQFLDYPANAENIEAWKSLSELLEYVIEKGDDKCLNTMQCSWRHRADIWQVIHFGSRGLELLTVKDCELALYKTQVLVRFCPGHPFADDVLSKLPAISESIYTMLKTSIDIINTNS